ncbi:unnamed protein product [Adineta steineri]|uniref:SNTX MACPF/CDC-like domain-containing protein n=1 Tax=Adineta steineri TaxID=433720 RepID=A0A819VB03_9BILA|nr:unnamed protein product [Adineta steineri]CAF4106538.1 unnamed protein product [Adineta steineri]
MARRITRPALGRSGQLGDLYDGHIDDFLTGNIFGNSLPDSVVRREDFRDVTFKFDRVNNYSSTFEKLNMEAELQLSILSGILKVEGHGKYMSNINKSSNSHKITLSLFIKRQRDVLQVSFEELTKYICEKAFADKSATHVVTEVLWGANIFAMFEQQKNNRDEREAMEGELTAELQKAGPLLSGQGKAMVDAEDIAKTNVSNLHIEFGGDLEMTGVPTTIPEALKMIKTIPDSISRMNGGKGVPVQFILSPITDVIRYVSSSLKSSTEYLIIREANDGLVRLIQFTFDELLLLQQKINQLVKITMDYRDIHLPHNDINDMNLEKIRIEISIDDFRRRLAVLLKNLRQSTTVEEEENFAKNITQLVKQQCKTTANDMEQFLLTYKHLKRKCEIIEQLESMNVECLKLDERFYESPDNDVYILITSNHLLKTNIEQFEKIYNEFITLINQKKSSRLVFQDKNDIRLSATKIEHLHKQTPKEAYGENQKRTLCKWRMNCHDIKDSKHCEKYSHPNDNQHNRRTPCKWGMKCHDIKDNRHCDKYSHPDDDDEQHGHRTLCKWGSNCTNSSTDHRRKYSHPINNEQHDHCTPCKWGSQCTYHNNEHRKKYSHPNT